MWIRIKKPTTFVRLPGFFKISVTVFLVSVALFNLQGTIEPILLNFFSAV